MMNAIGSVLIFLVSSLLSSAIAYGQSEKEEDVHTINYNQGRILFQTNCGVCHHVNRELVGPMLASITKKRSEDWLVSFIRNSQRVISNGDPYANFMFDQYDRQVMPSFEFMPYEDIKSILEFIEQSSQFDDSNYSLSTIQQDDQIDPGVLRGKVMFRDQCQSCHFLDRENFGPALGSVTKRHPYQWLEKFIRNSTAVIESGDEYAKFIYENFDHRIMVPMPFLKDEEIKDVLRYIEYASVRRHPTPKRISQQAFINAKPEEKQNKLITKYVFVFIFGVSTFIFIYLLIKLFRYLSFDLK